MHRSLRARARRRPSVAEVRRGLERVLGAPAPSECRREIAAWLALRKVFRSPGNGATEPRPVLPPRARLGPLRWAVAMVSGLLLALALAGKGWVVVESVPLVGRLLAAAEQGLPPAAPAPPRR